MNRTTIETILKAMPMTSNDPTRIHLNGVNVKRDYACNTKYLIQATDGHVLFKGWIEDYDFNFEAMDERTPGQVIIENSKANINKFKEALKDKDRMIFPDLFKTIDCINRDYPRTEVFEAWPDHQCYAIGLDLMKLNQIIKSVGTLSKKRRYVAEFRFKKNTKGNLNPVYLKLKDEQGLIDNERIIMPVRL